MPSDKRIFTLRLFDSDYEKMKIISSRQRRSMANLIEYLVMQYIEAYEAKNGQIEIEPEPDDFRFKFEFDNEVLAAHRTDDPMTDLPEEALQSIEEFKKMHIREEMKRLEKEKQNKGQK